MNQTDLAKKIGIDPSYLSHIKKGRKKPQWPVAKKLAEITKTDIEIWMEGDLKQIRKAIRDAI